MKKRWTLAASALLAAGSAAADIQVGDTLNLTYLGYTSARKAVYATVDDGATTKHIYSGILALRNEADQSGLQGFCVQILESTPSGVTQYDVKNIEEVPDAPPSPMGAARATLIQDLYARHYDAVMSSTGSAKALKAAAFGLVIWEIVHQASGGTTASTILASLNLTAGNTRFDGTSSSILTEASTMLNSLGDGGSFQQFGSGELFGLTNGTYQDFLIVVPGPTGLAALVGIVGLRRRRRS